ncbi:NAD-dependent epimerase/dehydratase family protein [Methylobacterium sp. J-001]|uniref:NAD-dependent epimerase/dehydratase family protein n=1 Tax=Methylobacterium sp. J-001 TaxID=2836609 RepID=UPI001FBA5E1D|nr:NAD-dependent epimerase/dehydratase family protein [Methylobacterium sp. J-001]MCJ2118541.1 NAD-dependent epimerase/dehydratase family protein [Methylobacterium sp. J-001]
MKTAFVTGANGFLGRRLVSALKEDGWRTTGIVRHDPEAGDLVVHSLREENFRTALTDVKPDLIIHGVGTAGPMSPRNLFEANLLCATDLFLVLDQLDLGTAVVLIGSAAEYGYVSARDLPVLEEHICVPLTTYGVSKFAQTALGLSQKHRPVLCARLFNPVGLGMPSYLALGDFTDRIRRGETELRVGNLAVRRDFICVDEAARLICALCMVPDAFGQVINICAGEAFELKDIVTQLTEIAPQVVNIVTDPLRVRGGEMPEFYGSTARLRRYGITPNRPDFTKILKGMIAHL